MEVLWVFLYRNLKNSRFQTDISGQPVFRSFIAKIFIVSKIQSPILTLTGLRGFAALWVVLFHTCYGASNGYLPGFNEKIDWGILRNVIVQGVYAVDIFFVLSGYILTHVHRREFEKTLTLSNVKSFLLLRLARIYPLHLAIVILLSGAYFSGIWDHKVIALKDVVLSVSLTNAWSDPSINTPAWSVSTEWMAYLAFPIIIPLLVRMRSPFWQFIGILGLSAVYPLCVMGYDWGWDWHWGWVALFRVMNGFVLGCLLYYFQENCPLVKNSSLASGWCFGFLILLVFFLVRGAPIIFIYPFFPWVILTLAHARHGIGKVFSNKVAIVMGTISFSIYMVHYPVLELFRFGLNEYYSSLIPGVDQGTLWVHLCFILFSVIAASCLCYWSIEKRCREYLKPRWGHPETAQPHFVEHETSGIIPIAREI